MSVVFFLTLTVLFSGAFYMLVRKSMLHIMCGVFLLGHAVHLLLFASGGLRRGAPAFVSSTAPAMSLADPLPQALVLTALVISLAVGAFVLLLLGRLSSSFGKDQTEQMQEEDD